MNPTLDIPPNLVDGTTVVIRMFHDRSPAGDPAWAWVFPGSRILNFLESVAAAGDRDVAAHPVRSELRPFRDFTRSHDADIQLRIEVTALAEGPGAARADLRCLQRDVQAMADGILDDSAEEGDGVGDLRRALVDAVVEAVGTLHAGPASGAPSP